MKKIILALVLGLIFIPNISFALGSQRCWTQPECEEYRKQFVNTDEVDKKNSATQNPACKDDTNGFYSAACHPDAAAECFGTTNAVGEKLGFCLPAGQSVTKISFGGRNQFSNIGDFIQFIYKYGIMVAGVAAVIVVITGGAMWIFSGGSPDTITSAKKKIGGAVMGLILLALSYSILNLVNPYLVNLRLPSIWAINTAGLAPPTCEQIKSSNKLPLAYAFSGDESKTINELNKLQKYQNALYDTEADKGICGNYYFVDGTKGQTCQGIFCEGDSVCVTKLNENTTCYPGLIAGNIINTNIIESLDNAGLQIGLPLWEWQWVEGAGEDIELYFVCNKPNDSVTANKLSIGTEAINLSDKDQWYTLEGNAEQTISKAKEACSNFEGVAGFVLNVEFNVAWNTYSEVHYLGNNSGTAIDLGLGETIYNPIFPFQVSYMQGKLPKEYLITEENLRQGIQINIDAGKIKKLR
jgi:hypothetical protein